MPPKTTSRSCNPLYVMFSPAEKPPNHQNYQILPKNTCFPRLFEQKPAKHLAPRGWNLSHMRSTSQGPYAEGMKINEFAVGFLDVLMFFDICLGFTLHAIGLLFHCVSCLTLLKNQRNTSLQIMLNWFPTVP